MTAASAAWEEGDWNSDGVFDHLDIVAALVTGNYLAGSYAAYGQVGSAWNGHHGRARFLSAEPLYGVARTGRQREFFLG